MKNKLLVMLLITIVISLVGITALCASVIDSGTCGTSVTWTLDSDGTLTISGNGAMEEYFEEAASPMPSPIPWAEYRGNITEVVINKGVTYISSYAFEICYNITNVIISDSVTGIGRSAFSDCISLKNITIPDSVTYIAEGAFSDCNSLENITIPDSVKSIGVSAFSDCSSLTNITIPEGVTSIGSYAFCECTNLKKVYITDLTAWFNIEFSNYSNPLCNGAALYVDGVLATDITIPEGITNVGDCAFEGCTSIASVVIPEGVTSIGSEAFYNCSSLTSITIPDSITSVGNYAFYGCHTLGKVHITDFAAWCGISFGYYSNPLDFGAVLYINGVLAKEITIPYGVTKIDDYMFRDNSSLINITIPESVTSIGKYAFSGCSNLTSITIPESVTSIGWCAFSGCSSLTSIVIPEGVTRINRNVFEGCYNLTSITIPDSVTIVEDGAFEGCGNLSKVYISDIAAWCEIEFGDNPLSYGADLYINGVLTRDIIIPKGVTSIDSEAFYNCISITSITLPDSITSIGREAFYGCTNLNKVYINDLAAWCDISFGYYSNPLCNGAVLYIDGVLATDITIPDGITNIRHYAFEGCISVTNVIISDGVTEIGSNAFRRCVGLTNVIIPESVTSIGSNVFYLCNNLTSVTLPKSVTNIESSAFTNCTSLESINVDTNNENYTSIDGVLYNKDKTLLHSYPLGKSEKHYSIPEGVISISDVAFYNCDRLVGITIPDSVLSVGNEAFWGCDNLARVTVPEGVVNIGNYAFVWCNNLESIDVDINNAHYASVDGVLFNKSKTELIVYPAKKSTTDYVIPDSVLSIGGFAFEGCVNLTSITIPNSVTTIDMYAFDGSNNLKSINIPKSVTSIDYCAFRGCESLESIDVDVDNANYILVDGVLFNKDMTELLVYPAKKNGTNYAIPDSVTRIGGSAFNRCINLTSITIPEGVTYIDYYAFGGYNSLKSIEVDINNAYYASVDGVLCNKNKTQIVAYPAGKSTANFIIPCSVKSIDREAYYGCTNLLSVTIPDSMTSIRDRAFCGCGSLTSITIPDKVTYINIYAFADCDNLTTVYYEGSKEEWDSIIVDVGNDCLENANVIFNVATVAETNTVLTESADGKYTYTVNAINVPIGSSILFVCYSGDKLSYMDMKKYTGNNPTYCVDSKTVDYDAIKVLVWYSPESMNQVCNAEIVEL